MPHFSDGKGGTFYTGGAGDIEAQNERARQGQWNRERGLPPPRGIGREVGAVFGIGLIIAVVYLVQATWAGYSASRAANPTFTIPGHPITRVDCDKTQYLVITHVVPGGNDARSGVEASLREVPGSRYLRAGGCVDMLSEWYSPYPLHTYIVFQGIYETLAQARQACSEQNGVSYVATAGRLYTTSGFPVSNRPEPVRC